MGGWKLLRKWVRYFHKLWEQRELFYYLVWRDIKVRYKETFIGVFWVLLQPFLTMVVFSFVFGQITKFNTREIPYPLFIYTGLLLWNLFTKSINSCSESLLANQQLVKKVAFSRILLPVSSVVVNLIDFVVAGFILVGLMVYYQFNPQLIGLITLTLSILAVILLSLGLGLPLAILNVYFRDVRFVIPYVMQLLLFLTPVLYPADFVQRFKLLLLFNPLSGVIVGTRSLLLGDEPFNGVLFWFSLIVILVIFVIGVAFFQNKQKQIADLL